MPSPRRHHQKRKTNQDGTKFGPPRGETRLEDLRDVGYVASVENGENVVTEELRANLLMGHLPRVRVFAIIAKENLRIGGAREQTFRRRNMQEMDDRNNQTF